MIVGATTSCEMGWKGVTDSNRNGITRNPWNTDRTPGGSSGGAGAAAALNLGVLHLGTDGGGSIRMPAAFTGTFGIKQTFGRVAAFPASAFGTVAHVGPMTRTVRDGVTMLNILSQPDTRDWFRLPPQPDVSVPDVTADKPLAGLRVAYCPDLGYMSVDAEVAECVDAASQTLTSLGAEVTRIVPPFDNPQKIFETLWFCAAQCRLSGLSDAQLAVMDAGLIDAVKSVEDVSLNDYLRCTAQRTEMGGRMEALLHDYDVLITPTLPFTAFKAGQDTPSGQGHWTDWAGFNYPFNLTQQPSCSVPCGFDRSGLPIGLQITAAKFKDATALRVAAAFEATRPNSFITEPREPG